MNEEHFFGIIEEEEYIYNWDCSRFYNIDTDYNEIKLQ